MKNILVPTDFSENAYNALKYGVNLFAKEVCVFHLLHTYTPSIYDSEAILYSNESINEEYRLAGLRSFEEVIDNINRELFNEKHSFRKTVSSNLLQDEIKRLVKAKGIDLILMGTQGVTGAAKILFGSHTINAIREAVCPVLAVPASCKFTIPENILLPSDFESDVTVENMMIINDIAEKYSSNVHILHIIKEGSPEPQQERVVKALTGYLKNVLPSFHLIKDKNVRQGIFHFQEKNSIDLLVMLRHKHSFFHNIFSSPVENELGIRLTSPLLVIPVFHKKTNS